MEKFSRYMKPYCTAGNFIKSQKKKIADPYKLTIKYY